MGWERTTRVLAWYEQPNAPRNICQRSNDCPCCAPLRGEGEHVGCSTRCKEYHYYLLSRLSDCVSIWYVTIVPTLTAVLRKINTLLTSVHVVFPFYDIVYDDERENTKIPQHTAAEEFERVQRTSGIRTLAEQKRSAVGPWTVCFVGGCTRNQRLYYT